MLHNKSHKKQRQHLIAPQLAQKVGKQSGEMTYVGEHQGQATHLHLISYDEHGAHFYKSDTPSELFGLFDKQKANWLDIDGIADIAKLEEVAKHFGFHPLMSEDIVNTEHLPKAHEYDQHLFLTLKMISVPPDGHGLHVEHLSLVLGHGYLISLQEHKEGDVFGQIRERIKANKGRLCKLKADYLFYSLIDAVVDHYLIVMEHIRQRVEEIEEELLDNPSHNIVPEVAALKKEFSLVRKLIFPLQEEIERLVKEESEFISEATLPYLHDVLDHLKHLSSTFEGFREMLYSLMDLYLTNLSHSMNAVMKTLTIITTIFIPLTFIAGIYGMNFRYMPELEHPWAYPSVLASMVLIAIAMIFFLRRRKWF